MGDRSRSSAGVEERTGRVVNAIDLGSEGVVVAVLHGAGVERYPHTDVPDLAPILRRKRPLCRWRGLEAVVRRVERGAERIADSFEHRAVPRGYSATHDRVMARQGDRHLLRQVFPAPGAPLDVGEKQRDGVRKKRSSLGVSSSRFVSSFSTYSGNGMIGESAWAPRRYATHLEKQIDRPRAPDNWGAG